MTGGVARTFLALCGRDAWVTVRHEPVAFVAQTLVQPGFFLFVFGRVLPKIGAAGHGYGRQLLPGVLALTLVVTALQNTAMPLVLEFSYTKEIEDRLLAPLPVAAVAVQKVLMAAARGLLAGLLILPLGAAILPGGIDLSDAAWIGFAAVVITGAMAGASLGLVLGTAVPPSRIGIVFAVVLTPLIFTGATFYPWSALSALPVFQDITLANPMTYVSEGIRGTLIATPHLAAGWIVLGLTISLALFGSLGVGLFERRAVD